MFTSSILLFLLRIGSVSDEEEDIESDSPLMPVNEQPPATRKRPHNRPDAPSDNNANKRSRSGLVHPFEEGTNVYQDSSIVVTAQSVAHKRFTRFALNDHLYNLSITPSGHGKKPLILNISQALKGALKHVLNTLQTVYGKDLHHQVYVTIIENKILHGLNSGNYDINTPSDIIANRVMSMLYNYLKSFQTLRINPSFKMQVKVLSVPHMAYMESKLRKRKVRKSYRKHFYRSSRE